MANHYPNAVVPISFRLKKVADIIMLAGADTPVRELCPHDRTQLIWAQPADDNNRLGCIVVSALTVNPTAIVPRRIAMLSVTANGFEALSKPLTDYAAIETRSDPQAEHLVGLLEVAITRPDALVSNNFTRSISLLNLHLDETNALARAVSGTIQVHQ